MGAHIAINRATTNRCAALLDGTGAILDILCEDPGILLATRDAAPHIFTSKDLA